MVGAEHKGKGSDETSRDEGKEWWIHGVAYVGLNVRSDGATGETKGWL